jgi:hypothetical protein
MIAPVNPSVKPNSLLVEHCQRLGEDIRAARDRIGRWRRDDHLKLRASLSRMIDQAPGATRSFRCRCQHRCQNR